MAALAAVAIRLADVSASPCATCLSGVVGAPVEGVTGTFHSYRHDSGAAAPIAFGGRETFAMVIDFPATAQPGPAVLT